MTNSHKAYIALGANLGDPLKALKDVICALNKQPSVHVEACSNFYQTEPIDSSGPDYVNAVVLVSTTLTAEELLRQLLNLEKDFGRQRPVGIHNAPRTMDLDLLTYDEEIRDSAFLTLPHPRMHQRAFVLVPMADIDDTAIIAGKGRVRDFLPTVSDQKIFKII